MKYSINGTGTIGYPNGKQNKTAPSHQYANTQKNEIPIEDLTMNIKMLNMRTFMRLFHDLLKGEEKDLLNTERNKKILMNMMNTFQLQVCINQKLCSTKWENKLQAERRNMYYIEWAKYKYQEYV